MFYIEIFQCPFLLKHLSVICHTANAISATANHILVKEETKCLELKKSIESASDVLSKVSLLIWSSSTEGMLASSSKKSPRSTGAHYQSASNPLTPCSTCPSGKNGGSLGEFGPGQMVKEFNDVVFTTGKVRTVKAMLVGDGHGRSAKLKAPCRLSLVIT